MAAPPSSLLLAISIAALVGVQVSGQSSLGLSCPSGFVLTPIGRVPGYRCEADPCFGNICGPGEWRNQDLTSWVRPMHDVGQSVSRTEGD